MESVGQWKVEEKTMSVLQFKAIQNPFTPGQQYIDAKHGLSGDVYCREARIQ
jgi:hypothetical protein